MDISGTYSSIQPVKKGDIVQLVLGKNGFVMKLYEKGILISDILNLLTLWQIVVFDNNIYITQKVSRGVVNVKSYNKSDLLWSQTINAMTIFQIYMATGTNGVFVLIRANGNIFIPGGPVIHQNTDTVWVLIRFSLQGQMIAFTTIKNPDTMQILYDTEKNVAVISGTSTNALTIGSITVVNNDKLYSFIVYLSPGLLPTTTIVVDNIIIDHIAVNNGNIIYTKVEAGITTIYFLNTNNENSWNQSLGILTVLNLSIFDSFITILGFELVETSKFVFKYDLIGTLLTKQELQFEGNISKSQFAYNGVTLLLYTIAHINTDKHLIEYNLSEDVAIWSTLLPPDYQLLGGTNSLVSVGSLSNMRIYGKRFPALVGVVSEILWPTNGMVHPGCPPGFHQCTQCPPCEGCTGSQFIGQCCPDNLLQGYKAPYIVKVDFIITKGLSPVVPGQEYFVGPKGNVNTDELGIYLGTALDNERVLMLATGGFNPSSNKVNYIKK
jgi:hypothetical protein